MMVLNLVHQLHL